MLYYPSFTTLEFYPVAEVPNIFPLSSLCLLLSSLACSSGIYLVFRDLISVKLLCDHVGF